MTTQTVPLSAVPSQSFAVTLGGQNCQISIYMLDSLLYMDLAVNNAPIFTAVVCRNLNYMVREAYLGFIGDLAFIDTQGNNDPTYDGLGTRYVLVYIV